jgi:hypothetical protein
MFLCINMAVVKYISYIKYGMGLKYIIKDFVPKCETRIRI